MSNYRFHLHDANSISESYEKNGFVIIKDFFPTELIENVESDIAQIIQIFLRRANISKSFDSVFDDAMEALEAVDHKYIEYIYDSIYQSTSFLRLVSHKNIEDLIKQLLCSQSPLYCYTNRCRIDPPQDERRTYGWHQEVFYTIPKGKYIQSWAPLVRNSTNQNGTIHVAVGSHKNGILEQDWNEIEGRATQIIVPESAIQTCPKIVVEVELGELLLFSGYLVHRSGENISKQHRYSLVGMYHDMDATHFIPPKLDFAYREISPRSFYDREKLKW
ncbi:hypothetical protein DRW07_16865 [Alteromonas sediminis]|uniref:Phytanoyl-CoA dioxygenase family protein n=1 Tax=Alteromonas sediminis TaxID=2259342 RepID=A0A3N5YJU5_9ALTE|nr:phytanoyl-CoA dioxygenase family protein [Alteromonas sediminis]RPJ64991.1 hypothetical protein DRW07_16865 [Alteromonas sediminis]